MQTKMALIGRCWPNFIIFACRRRRNSVDFKDFKAYTPHKKINKQTLLFSRRTEIVSLAILIDNKVMNVYLHL